MTLLHLHLFLLTCKLTMAFEICRGNSCLSSTLLRWRSPSQLISDSDAPAPNPLGRDAISGCYCRESPGVYTVCFGRENCKRVPKRIHIVTPLLKLKTTQIKELKPGDFVQWGHLDHLKVESNFILVSIREGTFRNLTKLTKLSVSYNNNLTQLEVGSFDGLTNLRHLTMIKNNFNNVHLVTLALAPRVLPRLFELSLNENSFEFVNETAFESMRNSSLKSLSLVLCTIDFIHPDSFLPLGNLEQLRLGENNLNSTSTWTNVIRRTIQGGVPLKLLNLFEVGFRKAPPKDLMETIAKSNITNLNLAKNQFEIITSQSFPLMPKLELLDLRRVSVLNITNDAFSNLPNLKTLLLSGNKLPTIPEGVLLEHLNYLDLQSNSGTLFFPSYFSIFRERFAKMKHLWYLNLSYNRMNVVYATTFVGLTNLRILDLTNSTIYHMTNDSFHELKQLLFLDLENNYFAESNPTGIELDVFRGLDNLKVLLLGGCSISFVSKFGNPFRHLRSLEYLGLERNKILSLSLGDFVGLSRLQSIDLSENQLSPWEFPVLSRNNPRLKYVMLSKNKLGFLTKGMLEDFIGLIQLSLDGNPMSCDCSTYSTIANLQNHSKILGITGETSCVFPAQFSNLTLKEYWHKVQTGIISCELEHPLQKLLLISLLVLLAIITTFAFLAYYYRWHLRYWIFLTKLYLSRKGKIRPKSKDLGHHNYEYDAFVSYSNEDRNFVVRLVAMLENYPPFLKLCVYERDFEIGTVISENVLESVAKSRKTLLVISDNYAKSQWCRWESQIAEHHRLFLQNDQGEYVDDTLVLVKLGAVSESHLTPTLKYLLKTRIYLAWDSDEKKQKVFWERLRGALGPPIIKELPEEVLENTYM